MGIELFSETKILKIKEPTVLKSGKVLKTIDIAYETQEDKTVYLATSKNAEFNVQRWGW